MDIALSEYINGPYEVDPRREGDVHVNGIAEPVQLRLYHNALVLLRRRGGFLKYMLGPATTVRRDERATVLTVTLPPRAGARKEEIVIRASSESDRNEWAAELERSVTELTSTPIPSRTASFSGASQFASLGSQLGSLLEMESIVPSVPTLPADDKPASINATYEFDMAEKTPDAPPAAPDQEALTNTTDPTPIIVASTDVRIIVRCMAQVVVAFVVFGCGYVGAARSNLLPGAINILAWGLAQPQYFILPWALGSKLLSFLFVAAVLGWNCFLALYVRYLFAEGHRWPEPYYVTWTALRQLFFATSIFFGIGGIWFIAAWRRGVVPQTGVILRRRGKCQRDMILPETVATVLGGFMVASVELASPIVGSTDTFLTFSTSAYLLVLVSGFSVMYIGRRHVREYQWMAMLRYVGAVAVGTFTCGRITKLIIESLQKSSSAELLDVYLPFVFVLYKLLFLMLYPYASSLTLRMSSRFDQMKYMFPMQVMDALILDAYAIVSPSLSPYLIFFVFLRVFFAVLYQSRILRVLTDRFGFTERSWTDGAAILPPSANRIKPSNTDVEASERAAAASRLHAAMREPWGDSPLADWLFFVQGALAGLCSVTALILLPAWDSVLPGHCVLLCGVSLWVVETRALISLFAWMVSGVLTFFIARQRMARSGFSRGELVQLTAQHLRKSLPILLTFGLPVMCYLLSYAAVFIQDINGVAHPPMAVTTIG